MIEPAAAVAVAKVQLGAEAAAVGAAARGLDLGARAVGSTLEAVVVVMVRADPCVRPGERRQIDEAAGLRHGRRVSGGRRRPTTPGVAAGSAPPARACTTSSASPITTRSTGSLASTALGCRRAVGPDRDEAVDAWPERACEHRGYGQLGLGAAPEEVGRRRREHGHVGREARNALGKRRNRRGRRVRRPASAPRGRRPRAGCGNSRARAADAARGSRSRCCRRSSRAG